MPDNAVKKNEWFTELGATGLNRYGGTVDDEFLRELDRATSRFQIYTEMRFNDPVIGAVLFLVEQMLRRVVWLVEPSDPDDPVAVERAEFVDSCMSDMSFTWDDFISECITFLPYGWSFFEQVFKKRLGSEPPKYTEDPAVSKYDDGLIGWRKFAVRAQESLDRWDIDETGGIQGMYQRPAPDYEERHIPIEKAMLFRTRVERNNPEGRALSIDTSLPCPSGWTTIGAIDIGDKIYDENGRIRYVVAKSEIFKDRSLFELEFSGGDVIEADEAHLWIVTTYQDRHYGRSPRVLTTRELHEELKESTTNPRFSVGRTPILDASALPMALDPYVLGYWLGDGITNRSSFAVHAPDVNSLRQNLALAGFTSSFDGNRRLYTRGLKPLLRGIGILNHKHIPPMYMRAGEDQRLALLQGLMDSDGTAYRANDRASKWYNSNPILVEQFCELVRSLGGRPRRRIHTRPGRKCGIVNGRQIIQKKTLYEVSFHLPMPVHRLLRKLELQHTTATNRAYEHYIQEVRPIGSGDTVCIQIDAPSGLFLAGKGMIPTHNSVLRHAYRAWYMKKTLEVIMAIGTERQLAGMPVIYLPVNATKADYDKARRMVEGARVDEYFGFVLQGPKAESLEDSEAGGWLFELATSGGRANVGVLEMLEYYDRRMSMSILAQFLILGSSVGSWALSRDQSDIFLMALEGWATMIAETINRHAIPKLMRMNGWDEEQSPHLEPSGLARANLAEMAQWIKTMFEVGMPVTDLEDQVRAMADLPPREESDELPEEEETTEIEEVEEEVEKQDEETWRVRGHVPTADEVESGWEIEESDIEAARRELAEMIGEPV